ncbi:MAG: hypothetical protein KBA49_07285 [Methanolinea sp.]|nr:hypothetical protein [Methanolinea sp.]
MFRRVKDLLGRKEGEEIQEIMPDDIPSILSLNEKAWEDEYSQSTLDGRKRILEIRDDLIDAVNSLSKTEREAAFHPKLEKIAKNSLPQCEKALLLALNRQLPEDPDAFYQACTEILKGCVKGLAGPGRYLRNVLPEEMKEIGMLVDAFGKEINILTPRVAEWRRRKEGVRTLRESHAHLMEMESTSLELSRDIPVLEAEIADLTLTSRERNEEKQVREKALEKDPVYSGLNHEASQVEHALREAEREVHSVISTLVHILRKAEKIAHHQSSEKLAKELNQVTTLLTGNGIPPAEEANKGITMVLPVMVSMIQSGEIQLKNQEERILFADHEKIPSILTGVLKEWERVHEKADETNRRLASYPPILDLARVESELKSLGTGIKEKEKRLFELKGKREEILPQIPASYSRMEAEISAMLGKKIRISSGR